MGVVSLKLCGKLFFHKKTFYVGIMKLFSLKIQVAQLKDFLFSRAFAKKFVIYS